MGEKRTVQVDESSQSSSGKLCLDNTLFTASLFRNIFLRDDLFAFCMSLLTGCKKRFSPFVPLLGTILSVRTSSLEHLLPTVLPTSVTFSL